MVSILHELLQIAILDIDDWDKIRVNQYSKENSSLEQNSSLHNQICTWYYQSKGKDKVPQEWQKDTSFQTLNPAIHLEGWSRHFGH